jgi:hypothetical protein
MKPAKSFHGVTAQEFEAKEVVDDTSATLGFVKLFKGGDVGILWSPLLFCEGTKMPDELRQMIVERLRFYADRLEDRSLDARMKELFGKDGIGSA